MDTTFLLETLSTGYLQAINDMCGLSLSVKKFSDNEMDTFHSPMKMITMLDFSGSIMGFFAVAVKEETAARIFDIDELPEEKLIHTVMMFLLEIQIFVNCKYGSGNIADNMIYGFFCHC